MTLSPNESMRVTIPVAVLMSIATIILSVFGFFITRTLSDINGNIIDVKIEIKALTEVRYNHESRLNVIEERLRMLTKESADDKHKP